MDFESLEMTERAVLFAALSSAPMRAVLVAQANVEWFQSVDHRKLFQAILAQEEQCLPVDSLSIIRAARKRENASFGDVVLEADWLARGVVEVKGMTIESFSGMHLPELRKSYQTRRLYEFFDTGIQRTIDGEPDGIISWALAELADINAVGQGVEAVKVADALMAALEEPRTREEECARRGPLTRVNWFDEIDFRLRPFEPITIAGRPAEGKSILSMQFAIGASSQCAGLVVPVEDGEDVWLERYLRQTQGAKMDRLRSPLSSDAEHIRFHDHYAKTKDRPLYIARNATRMRSFDILALLQKLKAQEPGLGFVLIDQMYRLPDYRQKESKGELDTSAITRTVMRLVDGCNALGVCPIMLQHVGKDIIGDPQLKDISDSYIFERMSRKIILVSRPNIGDAGNDNFARINIAKWTMEGAKSNDLPFDGPTLRIDNFVDPALREDYEDL